MFQDRDKELKRLEQALLEEEEETEPEEEEEPEEYEEEFEEESEDEEEQEAEPPQNPRALIAVVLLVTAGLLLFLAYLLAKREGLI